MPRRAHLVRVAAPVWRLQHRDGKRDFGFQELQERTRSKNEQGMNREFGSGSGGVSYNRIIKPDITPGEMETKMTTSLFRNTALALVAVAGLSAAPAYAGGFNGDDGVIYADQTFRVIGQEYDRPAPQRDYDEVNYEDEFLSPRQVSRILRNQGYGRVTELYLRGDTYRAIAVRQNGAVYKLRVDAENGYVVSARRIGWEPRRPHHRNGSGLTIEFGWDSRR
jgi:uncharacterized membrane protein YkoI